jgi:hypothetical protein
VDQVDDDVDGGAAPGGLGLDQLELVTGAVYQHDPGPVVGVAVLGLVEDGGHDAGGGVGDRPGQPLAARLRVRVANHVIDGARRGLGVVDRTERGHALASQLLPDGQARLHRAAALLRSSLRGGLA